MQKQLKLNNNENLLRNLFEFLTVKDLSLVSQVSHIFHKSSNNFNHYWKEHTKNLFCSNIEHYNILTNIKENRNEDNKSDKTDWKNFLKLGFHIRNVFNSIIFSNDNQTNEIISLRDEIFSNLKEYYSLPKLRKENLYVESEINTILQTYLYDFVYDQQDLYDYYDQYFKDYSDHLLDMNNGELDIRTSGIPFSYCLHNFEEHLYIFENDVYKSCLGKLRWYHYDEDIQISSDLDNSLSLNKKISSILLLDDTELSFKYPQFQISINQLNNQLEKYKDCSLICFFTSLIYSLTYFCKLSYKIILNCSSDDSLFLNEYIKRHKSYTDAAINLNDHLENFNILINYLYENSYKNFPDFPKFSVFRLMIIIWYREVLGPLEDQNLISNKLLKLFKKYMIKEINKTLESNNINFKIKLKDSPPKEYMKEEIDVNFSLEGLNNNGFSEIIHMNSGIKNLTSSSLPISISSNNSTYSTQNSFTQPTINNKEKIIVNEEFNNLEFQNEYFIEQTLISLIDFSLNEFSVFYINSTKIHVNKYYESIENRIINFIDDMTKNFKKSKIELLQFFKNSDFLKSKLINRTKLKLISTICNNFIKLSYDEIFVLFEEYICKNSNIPQHEAQSYLKLHGDLPELALEKLNEQLLELTEKKSINVDISKYLSLTFIKESLKNKNHPVILLEEATEWLRREENLQISTDELIESENTRRHIGLKREHEEKMYNFTSNLTWENIVHIYNTEIKPKLKNQNKFLDLSESSNLDLIDSNNNNLNEIDNNNSMDIDLLSLGKR